MKKLSIVFILIISLALGGCAGMSDTEQRTLSGGAIGAVAGTAGGYLYDHHKKAEQKAHDQAYDEGYDAGKKSQ